MEMTGAQILMAVLKEEKVDTVFGFPGGAVIDIYDELVKTDIRHILVRHEQGAVHAADGYARASGQAGVCLVTSGPGATNTVTGIATAYMDSIPMVVVTGQVPTPLIGNDAFQECDTTGITRPCTKHNYLVKESDALARTLHEAFYVARSGRPGPVVIALPEDMLTAMSDVAPCKPVSIPEAAPAPDAIKALKAALDKAKRPLIITGGGGWTVADDPAQVKAPGGLHGCLHGGADAIERPPRPG